VDQDLKPTQGRTFYAILSRFNACNLFPSCFVNTNYFRMHLFSWPGQTNTLVSMALAIRLPPPCTE